MWESGASLEGTLEYNTDLFDQGTAQRMLRHYLNLLEGLVQHPEQRLSELPLLSAAEKRGIAGRVQRGHTPSIRSTSASTNW